MKSNLNRLMKRAQRLQFVKRHNQLPLTGDEINARMVETIAKGGKVNFRDETLRGELHDSRDGSIMQWAYEEHVPYEPAAYQHDEGFICFITSDEPEYHGPRYFISAIDGAVYGEDDDGVLCNHVDHLRCPAVDQALEAFSDMMNGS